MDPSSPLVLYSQAGHQSFPPSALANLFATVRRQTMNATMITFRSSFPEEWRLTVTVSLIFPVLDMRPQLAEEVFSQIPSVQNLRRTWGAGHLHVTSCIDAVRADHQSQ